MQITVSGRHMEVSDTLRGYAEEKTAKLARFYDRVLSADVVFDVEASDVRCEIIARADHQMTFVAKESHADASAALDATVKDLERQLTRHKEKHRNRKHTAVARTDTEPLSGPTNPGLEAEGAEGEPMS